VIGLVPFRGREVPRAGDVVWVYRHFTRKGGPWSASCVRTPIYPPHPTPGPGLRLRKSQAAVSDAANDLRVLEAIREAS
jgi:hypothetical protein